MEWNLTNGALVSRPDNESADREYWTGNEGLTSELRFHKKLYHLVGQVSGAYRQNDMGELSQALNRLIWVEDYLVDEPFLSVYESGLVMALLNVAHACSDRYLVEEAYPIVAGCRETLIAKRERRKVLGLPFRADSESWYRLYEITAELKWKGGSFFRNLVIPPEQLIKEFTDVEDRCLQNLSRSSITDENQAQRILHGLGWSLLQIIKMSIRWCPDQHASLVQRFNKTHGNVLSTKTGQFMAGKPLAQENPWYWDHELFKWCVLGPGTEDEAALCHQWRLDSMRAIGTSERTMEAYRYGTGRELNYLLSMAEPPEAVHVC